MRSEQAQTATVTRTDDERDLGGHLSGEYGSYTHDSLTTVDKDRADRFGHSQT